MVKMLSAAAAWPPPPSPTPFPYPLPQPPPTPPLQEPSCAIWPFGAAGPRGPRSAGAAGQCGPPRAAPLRRRCGPVRAAPGRTGPWECGIDTHCAESLHHSEHRIGGGDGCCRQDAEPRGCSGYPIEFAGGRQDILQDILEDILQE